jgi:hypothetical protein
MVVAAVLNHSCRRCYLPPGQPLNRPGALARLRVANALVRTEIFALIPWTPVRSLGLQRLAAPSQPIRLGTCHVLDESDAPVTLCGPILINRHHADRLETLIPKYIPAVIPVERSTRLGVLQRPDSGKRGPQTRSGPSDQNDGKTPSIGPAIL